MLGRRENDAGYDQKWEIPVFTACCERPGDCWYPCCCGCCQIRDQRLALIGGPDNYVCCNAELKQLSTCCNPCTKPCPECCACCEGLWCPCIATFVNRDLIRKKHKMEPTDVEELALYFTCLLEFVGIHCNGFITCCMGMQHEEEMRKRGDYSKSADMK